jgi:two-component system phosphate regulon response regulator PhoB
MAKENILIVEDEEDILELVRYNLSREGYQTTGASSGEEALKLVKSSSPDLVLLDLMLPGIDGLEVCRQLKNNERTKSVPVVMLTARGEESDVVTGLEMGADDYITKPFSPRVLAARVKAVLRRREAAPHDETLPLRIRNIIIHPGRHEVTIDGDQVDLTLTEFRILHFLASHPGWVFTRYQIVEAVHGDNYPVTDRSVDVQIVGLRKKLGLTGDLIETVRGIGYRFKE